MNMNTYSLRAPSSGSEAKSLRARAGAAARTPVSAPLRQPAAPVVRATPSAHASVSLPVARCARTHKSLTPKRAVAACSTDHSTTAHIPMHLDRDLDTPLPGFSSIADALEDVRQGKFLLVLDDESRENEGDLIIAASKVTTESMAYLIEYSSGVVCVSMEGKGLDRLKLPLMVSSAENEDTMYTAFAITCDLREGITTGISASDRAKTIKHMSNPEAVPGDFRRPGHIFPLRYRPGGVLVRPGHTEAAVDLSRMAGLPPVGVLCEVVNKADGSMARTPELLKMSAEHGVKCITIADMINYRLRHDVLVEHLGSAPVESKHGKVVVHSFRSTIDGSEHIAIVAGDVEGQANVLTHLQPSSSIPDVLLPSPGVSLDSAVQQITSEGRGVVMSFNRQQTQDAGASQSLLESTGSAGPSVYDCAAATQMLHILNVASIQLLSGGAQLAQTLCHCGMESSPSQPGHHANGLANGVPMKAALVA